MKKILFYTLSITVLSLLLGYFLFPTENCLHSKKQISCVKYLYNYDGDTITFNINGVHPIIGEKISIRLAGVDTPELNSKKSDSCEIEFAKKAKNFVADILNKSNRIDLTNIKRGKYFRIVADVLVDGKSLSKMLLINNLGIPYHGKSKKMINWCKL